MNGTYHCNGTYRFLLRTTLACILSLGLLLPGCARHQARESAQDGLELVILHVNDTHAHVAGIDKYGTPPFRKRKAGAATAALRKPSVVPVPWGTMFWRWMPGISFRERSITA